MTHFKFIQPAGFSGGSSCDLQTTQILVCLKQVLVVAKISRQIELLLQMSPAYDPPQTVFQN